MLADLGERLSTQLPRAIAVAAVVLSLAVLGLMVWHWQHQPGTGAPAPTRASATTEVVDPLPVILSGNLFGPASGQGGDTAAGTGVTREATGYTLRAAFAGTTGSGGAIIEASGSEARWTATGDTLADGAKLREVHPDYVVLERNGALEKLEFPRLADMPAAVAANGAGGGGLGTSAVESGPAEPIPTDVAPEEKARIIRQRLEELRNRSRT